MALPAVLVGRQWVRACHWSSLSCFGIPREPRVDLHLHSNSGGTYTLGRIHKMKVPQCGTLAECKVGLLDLPVGARMKSDVSKTGKIRVMYQGVSFGGESDSCLDSPPNNRCPY